MQHSRLFPALPPLAGAGSLWPEMGASSQMTPTTSRFCQSLGTPGRRAGEEGRGGAGEPPPLLVSVTSDVTRDGWEGGGDVRRGRRV